MIRRLAAVALVFSALLVVLAALVGPRPAVAQYQTVVDLTSRPEPRYLEEEDHALDAQAAFLHFATSYTEVMVIGLLTGGLLMNQLVGGLPATMVGTLAGALIASWLYIDHAADSYVVREVRPAP